ncbi:MAG TPA: dihydrolipoamide acetyltransferase family protein [Chitinophagaceae bacterium]|nr:dihydrolipoamide acetyltransferase family protein [Chitinophagaceae bacterium]
MAIVDLIMPKLGESIVEATILKWLKQPGDIVKQDETVVEIATDKVDSEVPSTAEGVLETVLYKVNDIVPVGAVIATLRTNAQEKTSSPAPATSAASPATNSATTSYAPVRETIATVEDRSSNGYATVSNGNRFYSPLVLNIAGSEGISMTELEKMPGTGNEGRVTKKDILQYISDKKQGRSTSYQPAGTTPSAPAQQPARYASTNEPEPATSYGGNTEIIEMDRMRKLIAEHMVRSKHTSPHVTSFTEADVTNLVQWRDKIKQSFEKREGTKITFTPLFIEAVVRCIKKYPLINSSLEGDRIIIKKDINIGMAAALPSGNLIVPVIKNADNLNLVGLTRQVNMLADNARNNKLQPGDIQGGTFTLTNVGTFGSLMGTPIINQPQVAILAVGAIKKRPVVIETSQGDTIGIRHMMYLSMSYDHRIIDGALGATFLSAVAAELQNFNPDRDF